MGMSKIMSDALAATKRGAQYAGSKTKAGANYAWDKTKAGAQGLGNSVAAGTADARHNWGQLGGGASGLAKEQMAVGGGGLVDGAMDLASRHPVLTGAAGAGLAASGMGLGDGGEEGLEVGELDNGRRFVTTPQGTVYEGQISEEEFEALYSAVESQTSPSAGDVLAGVAGVGLMAANPLARKAGRYLSDATQRGYGRAKSAMAGGGPTPSAHPFGTPAGSATAGTYRNPRSKADVDPATGMYR